LHESQSALVLDRSKLSSRESEVLDLAIVGLTDQEIARQLGISPSTVISYWVRIRGKLGSFSRTELVAGALRQSAMTQLDELREQTKGLQEKLAIERRSAKDSSMGELYRTILDGMPEAVMATDAQGTILYANADAEALFGYEPGELAGTSVQLLVPARFQSAHEMQIAEYAATPRRLRIGLRNVVFAKRKDGSEIRVILLLDAQRAGPGIVVSCVVRSFIDEVDTLRRRASAVAAAANST
jgi:PAS domain S-box-containing protein